MDCSTIECNSQNSENVDRKGIRILQLWKYEIPMPYKSWYPEVFRCLCKLYICEFCLGFENSQSNLQKHGAICMWYCPPGIEIYSKDNISVFEVDGLKSRIYCQNLCLLSKLFVKEKIQYLEVENFMFYMLSISDEEGHHIMGYFSKSKAAFTVYNLSSLMILPPYRRQGFGRLLIDFSYLLSKREGKVGTPEGPLSTLGMTSYISYWKSVVCDYVETHKLTAINIKEMSKDTAISIYDLIKTLKDLNLWQYQRDDHIVMKQVFAFGEGLLQVRRQRPEMTIDPSYLQWSPPDCIVDFENDC